jgi:general stress protein 26
VSDEVKHAAREVERSRAFTAVASAGYAANGLVHVLIGAIVLHVAFGGRGETDQTGAFKAVASVPVGFVALWILAVTLLALGLHHALDGILARDEHASRKWGRRISEWGQALVFIALGLVAASIALGARPSADKSAEAVSRGVLEVPGGPVVLGLLAIGVGVGGVVFIVMGVRRSFEQRMTIPDGRLGATIKGFGVVGFIAKGAALLVLGILLMVAAIRVEPSAAGGLDAAIDALVSQPYGPACVGAVGIGLVAYGTFCFFRTGYGTFTGSAQPVKPFRQSHPESESEGMTENSTSESDARHRLKELVEDIDFTMLTTRDASANLVSRPMSTREMDENGDIWFFLDDDSKKADEAEADTDVGLSYADAKGMRFVTIAGRASVVHDRAKMEQLYSPSLDIWFEDGLDTPGIALLRVTPVESQFWEPKHGKLVTGVAMLKALVTKDTPDDTMRQEKITG